MPRKTNIYKLDRRDIEERLILATVMEDEEVVTTIDHFCELFAIPLDDERMANRMADLNNLKAAILEINAKASKK